MKSAEICGSNCHDSVLESIPMFNPQPLNYRPLESRANLFAD